jgi:CheY-like chemotaxis protein
MRKDEARRGKVDVLIAGDDDKLRATVRSLLELQGYTCAEAGDGFEAVEAIRQRSPRCALIDLSTRGLDGAAVVRQVRADPRTSGVHIHCLSGLADAQSRRQAEEAGFEQFLTKPVDPSALLRAVQGQVEAGEGCVRGLTLQQAEDLLDWLQANGYPPATVAYVDSEGFAVRCSLVPLGGSRPGQSSR